MSPHTPVAKSWFVLCCEWRAELEVVDVLRDRTDIESDPYCPTETKWRRTRRERRVVRWPLMPGYLFLGLEPTHHGPSGPEFPFELVEGIEGVIDFVRCNGAPARVRYDAPTPEAEERRAQAWLARGKVAPERRLTVSEIRAMESAGAFDATQDRIIAEKAKKLAKRSFNAFSDLKAALDEDEDLADAVIHPFGPSYRAA